MSKPFFVFCGSSELSLGALEELHRSGILPDIVVTRPDRPAGRKMILTETRVSTWARENNITCLKPEKISDLLESLHLEKIKFINENECTENSEVGSLCLVVSYGKILPQKFLDFFMLDVWNVHPSDLPLYRGPSPIAAQVLDGLEAIPVCLIQMDAQMDHGGILEKNIFNVDYRNIHTEGSGKFMENLELGLGKVGGKSFADNYEKIISKTFTLQEQDHSKATFTRFIAKTDGDVTSLITILHAKNNNQGDHSAKIKIYHIWLAYNTWPGCYFFHTYVKYDVETTMRVKISLMKWNQESNTPEILKVIPEGRKEISTKEFESAFGKIF